ncbi:MAG TPA: hemerythrin domain-containing protein [Croceibacterium sp.]|nr:hemerythrin domain-containing protein [Croceibacterium sp.]
MSILDKLAATVMPEASDQDRAEARARAERLSHGHGWLAMALDHHRRIEGAFERARNGLDAAARKQAMKELALVLNGHSLAEETVLYPALVERSEKLHAAMAYEEHTMTKIQMHKLEHLDPMSPEWRDKLEHIRGAVLHHVYHEEGNWFVDLAEKAGAESAVLTQRFAEEFERYASGAAVEEPLSELA